ncbi:MAG: hypothetical protein ACRCSN_21195 [Dermatophilaceae bacterium]
MAASVFELVAVAQLLALGPEVAVHSVFVTDEYLVPDPRERGVDVVQVRVHAASPTEAEVLAAVLGLVEDQTARRVTPEVDGYGPLQWRTWRGWCPDRFRSWPVIVEIVAAVAVCAEAVA